MATSALSTSNVKAKGLKVFMQGAQGSGAYRNTAWMDCFDWDRTQNVNKIQVGNMTGIGLFGAGSDGAAISPSTIAALDAKDLTYTVFQASVVIEPLKAQEIPGYRDAVVARLGAAAIETLKAAAGAALAASFSSSTGNHAVHGAKTLIATDHETATGTRSNLIPSAFDREAYLAASEGMATFDDYQGGGLINDLTGGGLNVIYAPSNREAVGQALLSSVTSAQNQFNVAQLDDTSRVEFNYFDTDDVLVTARGEGVRPHIAWERKPISIDFAPDVTRHGNPEVVKCEMVYAFGNKGTPDGAFGCVA